MDVRRILLVALAAAVAAPFASADWASFHNDSRNTGSVSPSDYEVYTDVWWSNRTLDGAKISASLVLKDGRLITADEKGLVRALDAESGRELWRYKMADQVVGTPAIEGDLVFVIDIKGNLKGLDLRNGAVERSIAVGATRAAPTIHEGKLFIGTEAGDMKAYLTSDPLTLLWSFKTTEARAASATNPDTGAVTCSLPHPQGAVRMPAAVFDQKVFFGSLNHYVYAVNANGLGNGKTTIEWTHKTDHVVVAAPTINIQSSSTQRVVFGSQDGKLYSFNPSPFGSGSDPCYGAANSPSWTYQVPSIVDGSTGESQVSSIESSPASVSDKVFVGANNGFIYAIQASNGQKVWDKQIGNSLAPVKSSPAVANGHVIVGSGDKNVYWLNANDGTVEKQFSAESAVSTSPAIDGKRAFVAADEGTLYMFGPQLPPRPDLEVTGISHVPDGLQVRVRNGGDAASADTTIRLFDGGTFVANVNLSALNAGEERDVLWRGNVSVGSHEVRALVDPGNLVVESIESNNDRTETVEVAAPTTTPPPPEETDTETEDPPPRTTKKDEGIPGPGVALLLAGLALVALRRRQP